MSFHLKKHAKVLLFQFMTKYLMKIISYSTKILLNLHRIVY
jgi:hypothetical protein